MARFAGRLHLLHELAQLRHVIGGVGTLELLDRGQRCVAVVQRDVQTRREQLVADRVQPLRALGMTRAHVVQTALGVAVEGGGHGLSRIDFRDGAPHG